MFMYTIIKARLTPFQKTLGFKNGFKSICVINNFVRKDQEYHLLGNKTNLEGSRNMKKKYF